MASLVKKGDTIYVPSNYLGGDGAKKVNIKWSQSLQSRNDNYWICNYTVKNGGNASGIIFVQESKGGEFKGKNKAGEREVTLEVNDAFQYGQDKAQTIRFLVFHNKDNKPYQHRFVENVYTTLGHSAAETLKSLGVGAVSQVEQVSRNFIGDYLRNF